MNIIFLLLKILCVVLQIVFFIVLLILFLLLVILFANLRYQFKSNTIDYEEKKCLDFDLKATYLFSIIKVYANKKDDKIKILVKIFGYSLYKNVIFNSLADNIIYKNEGVNTSEEENKFTEDVKEEKEVVSEEKTTPKQEDSNRDKEKTEEAKLNREDSSKNITESTSGSDSKLSKNKERTKKSVQADRPKSDKKTNNKASEKDKEKSFIDTLKNKDFILKAFDAVIKFLKNLKPQKFIVRLKLGFLDPSLTGKIIGALYTVRGITGLDIHCEGEFNEATPPDIFVYMKGKISIFKVIRPFLFIGVLFIKFTIKNKFNRQKGE